MQLMVETVPLAVLGGLAGLWMASWTATLLTRSLPDWGPYADLLRFRLSLPLFGFASGITLLCAVGSAVYPAFRATRGQLSDALRAGVRSSASRGQGLVARGVVIAQVSLAIVLVTAASLFAVTMRNVSRADGGFAKDNLLLASLESRGTPYEQAGMAPLRDQILESVRTVPNVEAAAMASLIPLFGGNSGWIDLDIPGFVSSTKEAPSVPYDAVMPGYFDVMGIPLRNGRDFAKTDAAGSEPVAIISAAMARRFFGDADPVGRSFRARIRSDSLSLIRIVGVARDAKYFDMRSTPEPMLYVPLTQTSSVWANLQVALRVNGAPSNAFSAVQRAVDNGAPGIRVRRITSMREQLDLAMSVQRLATGLVTFAGVMVLVLSIVGLYSVVAYSVARRTSELGVRMALGANATAIVWLVARETLRVVLWGVVLGLPLSFIANQAIGSQLYGVGAHDPWVVGFSMIVFVAVALMACAVPARRAVRIDPCIALAAE
jgi:putative ABC transport system permease protein